MTRVAAAALFPLMLAACSKALSGTYDCPVPMMRTLTLNPDGSYATLDEVMGTKVTGKGTHTVTDDRVTLAGTQQVEGEPSPTESDFIFHRLPDGSLKTELGNCTRK
jgi:hypothetical protein